MKDSYIKIGMGIALFIEILIFVAVVASFTPSIFIHFIKLNSTFEGTGIGGIFSAGVMGIMIVFMVLMVIYATISNKTLPRNRL